MEKTEGIRCPVRGNKNKAADTELKTFLFTVRSAGRKACPCFSALNQGCEKVCGKASSIKQTGRTVHYAKNNGR